MHIGQMQPMILETYYKMNEQCKEITHLKFELKKALEKHKNFEQLATGGLTRCRQP